MRYVYAVITDIDPDWAGDYPGNFYDADPENVRIRTFTWKNDDDDERDWDKYFNKGKKPFDKGWVTPQLQVFELGEVVILDGVDGREVCGGQRKPSKWYVEVEHFTRLSDAVKRSREVVDGSYHE